METKRPDSANYTEIFLTDTPLLDTRAPTEFARGSFPNAENIPLMNDLEREQVGTCYKQHGQDAAIALGHKLVCDKIKTSRVNSWLNFAERNPQGYLFCFRGGLRSQISQQWLSEAGCDYPRIEAGYKAMRRFLIDNLELHTKNKSFVIVGGQTGSAKTELLPRISSSLDLEGLANHRGSAFGKRVAGQPAQITFENAVAIELLKLHHQAPRHTIIVEDESKLIGRCALPESLRLAMSKSPLVVVETLLSERVEHSFKNYILHNLIDCQQLLGEEAGFARFATELLQSLDKIRRRLGGARHTELQQWMNDALEQHRRGDSSGHLRWIETLLRDYYDPMYNYQIEQKKERVIFSGRPNDVVDYLNNHNNSHNTY
ncbi:tRNA 2-selenouridine(34) synthase MnmH [Teredinibacter waterburyi]|uniref:tRNA 2-selenouridine(34) synthase MnmH n=1 Tax=Teredinibacter waterburyi TaxID=1500538 RepID=UPI00165FA04A|nr:tRNA 2-selenouridine(34) synthase MnmH [Teredinibacter waterburyi]